MSAKPNRRTVRVTYENGDSTVTDINGTEEEIRRYYLGNVFNIGKPHATDEDYLQTVVAVDFLN